MVTVQELYSFMNELAPVRYRMDFDNVGLLVGDPSAQVTRVVTALDITDDVISEACDWGAEIIISHHPLIFHALKQVSQEDLVGRKILAMARSGIAAICMHTNLDVAQGGVNDALMETLGGQVTGLLEPTGFDEDGTPLGCGRIGTLSTPMELADFLKLVTSRLLVSGLKYCGESPVQKIAVCGGSGGSLLELAFEAGCDTLVTADVKYDRFLAAKELGVNLIDADHFCTENVVVPVITEKLRTRFPEVEFRISERLRQTSQFYLP